MPADRVIEFRYEDFCRDPRPHFERLGVFLDIDLAPRLGDFAAEPRHQEVMPGVKRTYDRKAEAFRRYLDRLGRGLYPDGV